MNRLITNEIGNHLADRIIKGQLKMGETAEVKIRDDKEGLEIDVKPKEEAAPAAAT